MIKIGIIGWSKHLLHISNMIREMEAVVLTGWANDNSTNDGVPDISGILSYPSLDALVRHIDAVVITYKSEETIATICKCLKNFKHVFLLESQYLNNSEVSYILKIAEESNVIFYPEFGSIIPNINELSLKRIMDVQFINITQTFLITQGICLDGRISLALLRNTCFVSNLINANVKKVSANGWGFSEPGTGMLNARINFDNGASVNILFVNSLKKSQIDIDVYGRSEILRINSLEPILKVSRELLTFGQLENCEKTCSSDCSLARDLIEFFGSINHIKEALNCLANQQKSFKVAHNVQEKLNHFVDAAVFYS